MIGRVNYTEEARALLADAKAYANDAHSLRFNNEPPERVRAALDHGLLAAAQAHVHANLAVAEQLRLANLLQAGAIGGGPMNNHTPGHVQSYLRREWPEIAAMLGVNRDAVIEEQPDDR